MPPLDAHRLVVEANEDVLVDRRRAAVEHVEADVDVATTLVRNVRAEAAAAGTREVADCETCARVAERDFVGRALDHPNELAGAVTRVSGADLDHEVLLVVDALAEAEQASVRVADRDAGRGLQVGGRNGAGHPRDLFEVLVGRLCVSLGVLRFAKHGVARHRELGGRRRAERAGHPYE